MRNSIKKQRKIMKLSQEELAKKSGVSRTIISELETQKKMVTTNTTIEKIAKALNCKVSDIFFLD